MKFKALLAATLLLPITAGATHFQSLEEAFYASRFNEIQANFEEPIAFYYLTDIDFDGVCELFVFNEDLSMASAFCCGGGNLSVLASDIRTANLHMEEGVVRTWQAAGGSGAVFENYSFVEFSKLVCNASELSYESVVTEETVYESTIDGKDATHEEFEKMLPKDAIWSSFTENEYFSSQTYPVARLSKDSKTDAKTWGHFCTREDGSDINGCIELVKKGDKVQLKAGYEIPDFGDVSFESDWAEFEEGSNTITIKQYNADKTQYCWIYVDVYGSYAVVSVEYPDEWFTLMDAGQSVAGVFER